MDNGKLRLWHYRNAAILEVYTTGELTTDDVNFVFTYLYARYRPPFQVIIVRSGSYRMSFPAKIRLRKINKKLVSFAYVVKGLESMNHASRASRSYLVDKSIYICDSIDAAYKALNGSV